MNEIVEQLDLVRRAIFCERLPDWTAVAKISMAPSISPLCSLSLAPLSIRVFSAYFHLRRVQALSECYVRVEVYRKLIILDGWCSLSVQQQLCPSLLEALLQAQLAERARLLVSLASSCETALNPHLNGGAVDVTLADTQGGMLEMGADIDQVSDCSSSSVYETLEDCGLHGLEIPNRRRILYWVMRAAGFTHLPCQWWHFDDEAPLWAWYSTVYGVVQRDTLMAQQWHRQLCPQMARE